MKLWILAIAMLLASCASPEYVANRSNWDVCRLSMGGPHARHAEAEAQRRGVDCRRFFGAIQQQQANENAATQNIQRALQPAPRPPAPPRSVQCRSVVTGNTVQTMCD
jgi:hypothetical protein